MNRETVLRLLAMMHVVPRYPAMKSAEQIASELQAKNHKCDVRTVQRDLLKLSRDYAFTYEEEGRTRLWFWPRYAKVIDLPSMDLSVAMAFLLSKEYLRPLLPPATTKLIDPYFNRAEEVLRESPGALAAWRKRVCVAHRGPKLQEPKIADGVQVAVYDALLAGRQLAIEYRSRGAKSAKEHLLHPLGLVVYEGVSYLIATAWNYTTPVMYTLHRMKSAKAMQDAARRIDGFDLAEYARNEFGFPKSRETLKLVARLDPVVAEHLEERPLSQDQAFADVDGVREVSATVADTEDLRWWLLSFGELIEVRKPAALRAEMRKRLAQAAERYHRS